MTIGPLEAAKLLRVHRMTIYRWIRRGVLTTARFDRLSRAWWIDREEIEGIYRSRYGELKETA
jgi:excisionase family DNA binding protein